MEGTFFNREKNRRRKKQIFKDIIADNLDISGKVKKKTSRKKFHGLSIKFVIFFLAIGSYTLFTTVRSVDRPRNSIHSVSGKDRLNFSMIDHSSFSEDSIGSSQYSDYQLLLNLPDISIRDLFDLQVRTIIIDPGHGGEDPGTSGKLGTKEKDLTLDIAKRLKKKLSKNLKYFILLTRETDTTLSLEERIQFANSQYADLYISLHINYIPSKPYGIIETYYFGPNKDKRILRLAEKENRGSHYTMNDFKQILERMSNTMKYQESKRLARFIQKSLYGNIHRQNENIYNYGVKIAPFVVLMGVEMPSVLTEVTCLSNMEEEIKLNSEEYRDEIAAYLEEGISEYLKNRYQSKKSEV